MQTEHILRLLLLHTDIVRRHLGSPDTEVGISDQGYVNPNIYVAKRTRVWVFPFRRETAGCVFKCSLHLHTEEAIHRDNEWKEVAESTESILWRLVPVGKDVSVHDTHVINNDRTSLLKVVNNQVFLMLRCLIIHTWIFEK